MIPGMRFRPRQVELVYIKFKLQDCSSAITPNFKSPFQVLFNTLEVTTWGVETGCLGGSKTWWLGPHDKMTLGYPWG